MRMRLVSVAVLATVVFGLAGQGFAQSFEVVHRFESGPGAPAGRLLEVNGDFYGTTEGGGEFGGGTVFRLTPSGTIEILHEFRAQGTEGRGPRTGLVLVGGNLYGTTVAGGQWDAGTLFRLSLSGQFSVVYDGFGNPAVSAPYAPGANLASSLLAASDGWLYGVTTVNPTIFRVHPTTGQYEERFHFASLSAHTAWGGASALIEATDGQLYGTIKRGGTGNNQSQSNAGGVAYRMDQSGQVTILHQFVTGGSEIFFPATALTQRGGSFYGLTAGAGNLGDSAVYRMDFNGSVSVVSILNHNFVDQSNLNDGPDLALAQDGNLFVPSSGGLSSYGEVWKIDTNDTVTSIYSFPPLGGSPDRTSLLVATDGRLYGGQPGPYSGSIYRVSTTGAFEELAVFRSESGNVPKGPLFKANDGQLYGTASEGGTHNMGTVFRIDAQGDVAVLHAFAPGEGGNPAAGLRQASDGWLYGTASGEQVSECGTVFRISLAGVFQVVHTFNCNDGQTPRGPLVQANNLWMYGSTFSGGANGGGTIFRISTAGAFAVLHEFGTSDGSGPIGALVQASNGLLYGTTQGGGEFGGGTVFSLDLVGNLTVVHSFGDEPEFSSEPLGGLVQASDGFLYGTTSIGGEESGVLYRVSTSGVFEVVATSFDKGYSPSGELVEGPDRLLYGTTSASYQVSDLDTAGTIFRVGASGAVLTVKAFGVVQTESGDVADPFDGGSPAAAMIVGYDGLFYGTTSAGGAGSNGTIFKIALASETPAGSNVEVTPVDPVTGAAPVDLTFGEIAEPGTTTISISTATSAPPPPSTFNVGGTPTYFDVETTAVFAGEVQVCFDYTTVAVANPATAVLLHYNGTAWEDVTVSNNPVARIICGRVTSLSPFIVANPVGANYEVRAVFDQDKVYKAGSTVPIRIQILQDQANVSSGSLPVVATGLRRKTVDTNWATPEDPGQSNPDLNFVYQVQGGEPGYRFNLKTTKSYRGTYELKLTAGSPGQELIIEFQVR